MDTSKFQRRQAVTRVTETLRRHRGDFIIVLCMSVLMLLGLVVIYSISPALTARINAAGNTLDQNHFMYRQVAYLLVGVAAYVLCQCCSLVRKSRSVLTVLADGLIWDLYLCSQLRF